MKVEFDITGWFVKFKVLTRDPQKSVINGEVAKIEKREKP